MARQGVGRDIRPPQAVRALIEGRVLEGSGWALLAQDKGYDSGMHLNVTARLPCLSP